MIDLTAFEGYSVSRQAIADAAMSLVGIPFRHQGRSAAHNDETGEAAGLDCAGLIKAVLDIVGYPKIVDYEGYRVSPPASLVLNTFNENFLEIGVDEVGLGDIYLMRMGYNAKPKHSSILVSTETDYEKGIEPMIVHTYAIGSTGQVVMQPVEGWKDFCVKGFRLVGLT